MIGFYKQTLRSFRKDNSGAAMIEFAISLPLLLLVVGLIVEGSRITWTHQAAASGVRDAARYFARTANPNICDSQSAVDAFNADAGNSTTASNIVTRRVGDPSDAIFPGGVSVVGITPTVSCVTGAYQTDDVAVVEVNARLQIVFPFGGVFDFFGDPLDPLTTDISDESRVFGT